MKNRDPEITVIDDSDIDSNTKESVKKVVHHEAFGTIIWVIVLLILLALILPIFFNNSALKFQLEQKISQSFQTKFTIYGKVKVKLLPHLALVASDVVLEDYKEKDAEKTYDVYAESLTLQFPFMNFGESAIKKIILSDVVLVRYQADKSLIKNNEISTTIANLKKDYLKDESNVSSGITSKLFAITDAKLTSVDALPEVLVKNGRIISYDKFARKNEINSIDVKAEISKEKIVASGDFTSSNVSNDFKFAAVFKSNSSNKDSYLEVISPALELHLKGNYTGENKGFLRSDFLGDFEVQIMDLKSAYQSYVDAEGVIATRLKNNSKPIKITANLDNHQNQISVSNLKIDSEIIAGAGSIDVGLNEKIPVIDVFLDLENLDLDSLWSNEIVKVSSVVAPVIANPNPENKIENSAQESTETSTNIDENSDSKIDIELTKKLKNFELAAEINVKKIKYLLGEIKDSNLYFSTSGQGDIMVMPAIFNLPGETFLRVSGVFDNSTTISKFIGEFDGKGKGLREIFRWLQVESQNLKLDSLNEYSIYSDVLILPNSIALNNLILNLGDNEFSGELKFDNNGKTLDSTARIHANKFNLDDYFLISGQNTYFSPGVLLKKVFWLNDISSSNSFDLSFDRLIYKKEEFADQSFKLKVGRGYVKISDLNLQSPQTDLHADFAVDISDSNPQFKLKIDGKKFHYETPKQDEKTTAKINAFDQFFALPSLENFNGEIGINIDDVRIDDLAINKAKLFGSLNDGNIQEATLDGEFYGGKFSYRGALGFKINKIFNGNMSFNGLDLKPFLTDLFGIKNVSGIGNLAANITAISRDKNEFVSKLKSEIKFNINSPSVEGYGLSDLIQKMFAPKTYAADLQNPEKILFNSEAKTVFQKASGTAQINGEKGGKIKFDVSGLANNAVILGTFSLRDLELDILFNAIFLTGDAKKQIPINIATKIKGKTNNLLQNTNLDQVRQYLGLSPIQKPIEKTTIIAQ